MPPQTSLGAQSLGAQVNLVLEASHVPRASLVPEANFVRANLVPEANLVLQASYLPRRARV